MGFLAGAGLAYGIGGELPPAIVVGVVVAVVASKSAKALVVLILIGMLAFAVTRFQQSQPAGSGDSSKVDLPAEAIPDETPVAPE